MPKSATTYCNSLHPDIDPLWIAATELDRIDEGSTFSVDDETCKHARMNYTAPWGGVVHFPNKLILSMRFLLLEDYIKIFSPAY